MAEQTSEHEAEETPPSTKTEPPALKLRFDDFLRNFQLKRAMEWDDQILRDLVKLQKEDGINFGCIEMKETCT